MPTLGLEMVISYVCDGDINNQSIRKDYTIEDITSAYKIVEYIRWFQS